MKKLFNNRAFVLGLAACALLLMLRSIAAPLFDRPDFSDVPAPETYLDADPADASDPEATDDDARSAIDAWSDTGSPVDAAARRAPVSSVLAAELAWNDAPRRDPFAPVRADFDVQRALARPATPAAPELPRLTALVAGPSSLLAVLDDRVVHEGDSVGPYQVARIEPDGVRLTSTSGGTHWLQAPGGKQSAGEKG